MRHALALARRGLGNVAPNPAVGCVIVNAGRIVGRGWTQPGGRPHAETVALAQAGHAAKGATAYVSFEPCAHQGQTPACAQALIDAQISRVVIGTRDPDSRVSGRGIAMMEDKGIEVLTGICEPAARWLNAGFLSVITRGRPWVSMKLATSMDEMIGTRSGAVKWVTSPLSRQWGHLMRAQNDALLSGIGTVLADDPQFTCRLPGLEGRTPHRLILDTAGKLPPEAQLMRSLEAGPLTLFTSPTGADRLKNHAGIEIVTAKLTTTGTIDLPALMAGLARERGITRLMVECGQKLASNLFAAELVDEVAWFRSPLTIGDDGIAALDEGTVSTQLGEGGFKLVSARAIDQDVLETYVREAY